MRDARAFGSLLHSLSSGSSCVRGVGAIALGNIKDHRAGPALIQLLNADVDPTVKSYAAASLGEMRETSAVQSLISALNDKDGSIQDAAVRALDQLHDNAAVEPLMALLTSDAAASYDTRELAAKALGHLKDKRALETLMRCYQKQAKGDRELQIAILDAIGDIGDARTVGFLASVWRVDDFSLYNDTVLEDQDLRAYRWEGTGPAAVEALGKIGGPDAISELAIALRDPHDPIRGMAAQAFGRLRDSRGIDPLIGALGTEGNEYVRWETAWALRRITGQRFGDNQANWLKWRDRSHSPSVKLKPDDVLQVASSPLTCL